VLAGTPRGSISSTLCPIESIRSPTRRARTLTRIETGAPIADSQCESVCPKPLRRCNA
jgi:hypothetical protein